MGQYLSFPGLLLGVYGLWRAYKRREPAGWLDPGDARAAEADDEEEGDDADEEQDDADEEQDDADEQSSPQSSDKPPADPDVDEEFEDGKLKKRREP
jgi:hypothetical protein